MKKIIFCLSFLFLATFVLAGCDEIKQVVSDIAEEEIENQVNDMLGLTENEFMDKLPAFFEVLSTDHRFIMLENGLWDLKTKHSTKVVFDTDEDEEEIEEIEVEEEIEEDDEDKNIYNDNDDELDDDDDDLKDLVIIDEDEEANG